MSRYEKTWDCCGDTTITDAWEPVECPFCNPSTSGTFTQDQAQLLADTLGRCILASGMVRNDIDGLSGPQLVQFGEELAEHLASSPTKVLSDEKIEELVYAEDPQFDGWHEGLGMDEVIRIVRLAIAAAQPTQKSPAPMNETQLLVGSQAIAPALDDAFLEDGRWREMALRFVKGAIALRDAQWQALL